METEMIDITNLPLRGLVNQLRTYTELSNDEWQEAMDALCDLARYEYLLSDDFVAMLTDEIRDNLQNCLDNAEIIEEEVTETYTRKVRTLEWS